MGTVIKREANGRFKKGYSANNEAKFKKGVKGCGGRKKSRFRQIMEALDAEGEPISIEDFRKIAKLLLSLPKENLINFAKKKDAPIAVVIIASAIAGDIESKNLDNLERLLDRVFGKSVQLTDITTDGKPLNNNVELTEKQIDALIAKL